MCLIPNETKVDFIDVVNIFPIKFWYYNVVGTGFWTATLARYVYPTGTIMLSYANKEELFFIVSMKEELTCDGYLQLLQNLYVNLNKIELSISSGAFV